MRERSLEQAAAEQLQQAGFFVEREARTVGPKGKADVLADVLAWAGDESGELVPEVVVEVKAKLSGSIDSALAQLSRVAAVVGARRAFFFDGRWRAADPTFMHFEDAECPRPLLPLSQVRVPTKLIEREIWSIRDALRGRGDDRSSSMLVNAVLQAAMSATSTTLSRLCESPQARLALARILSEGAEESEEPVALASAMAGLLGATSGWRVLDPACRLGGLLWAVADVDASPTLQGWWVNDRQVSFARRLGEFTGARVEFECASFESILAKDTAVDGLISVLPFNLRIHGRARLADGSSTTDLDILMLNRVEAWLKPGGRAVLAVPPRLLFADSAAPLRGHLAKVLRVVAVIELPSGVFRGTNVAVGIVVLERSAPAETLVARLRADWSSQLAPSGEFFRAYQQHLVRGRR
jgi:hypothetical protein